MIPIRSDARSLAISRAAPRRAAVAILAVLLAVPAISSARETRTVDVLGSMTAEIDGQQREWLTIMGVGADRDEGSAVWSPYAPPAISRPSHLSEAQFAAVRERVRAMRGMTGSDASPATAAFSGDGDGGFVEVRITGFDPDAERMLRDGLLAIEVSPFPANDIEAALAKRHDAKVSHFGDREPVTGLFASAKGVGTEASVELDRLELDAEGGRAKGRFEATLCPVSALTRSSVDTAACVPVTGTFETRLVKVTPPGATR